MSVEVSSSYRRLNRRQFLFETRYSGTVSERSTGLQFGLREVSISQPVVVDADDVQQLVGTGARSRPACRLLPAAAAASPRRLTPPPLT